eukprot:9328316-Pyramimonas_sp.AAC.2
MNMCVAMLNYANAFAREGVGRTAFLVTKPMWCYSDKASSSWQTFSSESVRVVQHGHAHVHGLVGHPPEFSLENSKIWGESSNLR